MLTLGYECGDKVSLIAPGEDPPEDNAWTVYPLIIEHPIELGDVMTCVVCGDVRRINKIYSDGGLDQ